MHPYRSWACVTAHDDRSAGPRVQASTVSGATDHEPRRALSLVCVSSDEELTIDSRLLLRYSRNRCVMLGNESILVCKCVISTRARSMRAFVTTYRWPSHLKKQSVHVDVVSIHSRLKLTRDFLFWQAVHALSMSVRLDFPSRGRSGSL